MRKKGWVESSYWCLKDVEQLLATVKTEEGNVKIERVDEARPWLAGNSRVVVV